MTLQEILKAQSLTDEQIEKVIGEMKQNKIFTAAEENLDIRYKDLQGKFDTKKKEHDDALAIIEQYKKDASGNEALQKQLADAKAEVESLTKKLNDAAINAAQDRALIAAGANHSDLDYLKFQWNKNGDIVLDDNGEIKNGTDAISGLKIKCPNQFTSEKQKEVDPVPLPDDDGSGRVPEPANLAAALEEQYKTN